MMYGLSYILHRFVSILLHPTIPSCCQPKLARGTKKHIPEKLAQDADSSGAVAHRRIGAGSAGGWRLKRGVALVVVVVVVVVVVAGMQLNGDAEVVSLGEGIVLWWLSSFSFKVDGNDDAMLEWLDSPVIDMSPKLANIRSKSGELHLY
mmetsp:Transcript_5618/g.9771  ORF Transcript_5618/g.9771 Transcript_5618/m.9771 type:complete len:149 (-) Transcript_5618:160-606(-)